MSSNTLNAELMESVKSVIKDTIVEIFPDIIKQVAPLISEIIKEITPLIMNSIVSTHTETKRDLRNALETKKEHEVIFRDFREKNAAEFDKKLNERED